MHSELPTTGERRRVRTNGIELHTVIAGPSDGPPVVLLHGFPEFWYGWRHQISTLANSGYRVIVPDQRGYNRSAKPAGVGAYRIDRPMRDAVGLIEGLGYDRAHFVGHDWGAGVVWQLVMRHPERVHRAVTMNVPHPEVYGSFLTSNPTQIRNSWYILFFQLPRLPEWLCRLADWRGLRWFLETSNRDDTFTADDLRRYRAAWSHPGAVTSMLNWYRAMIRRPVEPPSTPDVDPPTMLIWGTQDPYMHPGMAQPSMDFCRDGRLERLEDATHWVQHEKADTVNDLLREFLQ